MLLLWSLLATVVSCALQGTTAYNGHNYRFVKTQDASGPATGSFDDTLSQMYAAGHLEGFLTSDRILQMSHNIYHTFFSSTPPSQKIINWLDQQEEWTRSHIKGPYNSLSTFWKGVAGLVAQYDGLVQGYIDAKGTNSSLPVSTKFAFQLLAGWGDMLDIAEALHAELRPNWANMTDEEAQRTLGLRGHCSALVKILGDYSDVFMGQSAWFTYGAMNRIYKHYFFDTNEVPARKSSFASYPGSLASQDDFYMMDSGLVMLQTTNGILNGTLYDAISSNALLAWQRVRLANLLATDGKAWCEIVAAHNSGTYNNQYMVIDTKKFQSGHPLTDGFFWLAEQIPGQVEYADLTNIVRFGYWPSYNIPYFRDIWVKSGYGRFGASMTHELAPRAQIFRRDQATVQDMDSFKHIMRYNNYKVDPYSHKNPGNAICSRFDLDPTHPAAAGCYDSKVTNIEQSKLLKCDAVNGPTTQNNLPPFEWISKFNNVYHEGQPNKWNFDFVVMDPKW